MIGNRRGSRRSQARGLYATMLKPAPEAVADTEGVQMLMFRRGHQRRSVLRVLAAAGDMSVPCLREGRSDESSVETFD